MLFQQNILLSKQRELEVWKIADFGLAKILETNESLNTFAGTESAYMAPQVYRRENYTLKADVWSLGVLFLEIITRDVKGLLPEDTTYFTNLEPSVIESLVSSMHPVISSIVRHIFSKMVVKDESLRLSIADIIGEFEVF